MTDTISTAQLLAVHDALTKLAGPRLFRVTLWGDKHSSTLAAFSVADARVRIAEMTGRKIAKIVDLGDGS